MKEPTISVGIPVYNGSVNLKRALISIVYQNYKNLEIIISNNCSTDNTSEIISFFKKRDKRIKVFNQQAKITIESNFEFVLEKSTSEYFMWHAADDFRSRDFIEKNINFLLKNKDYVASISPTKFFKHPFNSKRVGDFSIEDNEPYKRIACLLSSWDANARFWSLFRKEHLKKLNFKDKSFLGCDLHYMIHMVLWGKFKRIDEGLMQLGKSGTSNKKNIFEIYRTKKIEFFFPLIELLKNSLLLTDKIKIKLIISYKILLLNYAANLLRIKWLIIKIIR